MRAKSLDHEYAAIGGSADFCTLSIKLALGDQNEQIKNGQVSYLLQERLDLSSKNNIGYLNLDATSFI
jgi:hypothetical protein